VFLIVENKKPQAVRPKQTDCGCQLRRNHNVSQDESKNAFLIAVILKVKQ
jgi:hypothetical protein